MLFIKFNSLKIFVRHFLPRWTRHWSDKKKKFCDGLLVRFFSLISARFSAFSKLFYLSCYPPKLRIEFIEKSYRAGLLRKSLLNGKKSSAEESLMKIVFARPSRAMNGFRPHNHSFFFLSAQFWLGWKFWDNLISLWCNKLGRLKRPTSFIIWHFWKLVGACGSSWEIRIDRNFYEIEPFVINHSHGSWLKVKYNKTFCVI